MRFQPRPAFVTAALLLASSAATAQAAVAPAKPDITLLNKAIAALEGSKTLDSSSEMQMTATGTGMTAVFRERIHLVLQRPGRFHSDISLVQPDGTTGARYTVVSNGARVWVYQPGARSYAVMPLATFQQDDMAELGLFGSLIADSLGGGGLMDLKDLTRDGTQVQGGVLTVGGTDYQVFSMTESKKPFKFRFLLDPQAATIHRLDLNGRQQAMDLALTETISRQSTSSTPPPALFRFTPPPGTKRVKKITIGPF